MNRYYFLYLLPEEIAAINLAKFRKVQTELGKTSLKSVDCLFIDLLQKNQLNVQIVPKIN